jgi:uncharacterized protein (DUF924 family)
MTDTRRRFRIPTEEDTSPYTNRQGTDPDYHSSPRRSASTSQNDTLLYAFTVIVFIASLILGYSQMPSTTPPGLNKAIFNPRLYSHIQSTWFTEVPTGANIPGEASLKKWFFNPNADERAAFDKACAADFKHALEEVGPKRLRLPPFTNFTAERQMARNLASPLMSEIDTSSSELSTETAASNALSLILLLDQLSRNVYRSDQALIYTHYDRLSQALIHHILASQPRLDLVPKYHNFPVYRNWFYMPLMHSEHIEDHALAKSLMTSMKEDLAKVGDTAAVEHVERQLDFEKRHVDIIEKFGRYPYRNKVLARETTEEEKKWMEEGGDHFGTE